MKKKILLSLLVIVGLFTITGCGNSNDSEANSINNKKEETNVSKNEVYTCVYNNLNEKTTREITINGENILTLVIIENWKYDSNHEGLCSNKKYNAERLNKINGISATGECDELKGTYTTTYDIKNISYGEDDGLDNVKKIKSYISSNGKFDVKSWQEELEDWDYTCSKK